MNNVYDSEKMAIGAILQNNRLYDDLGLLPSDFTNVDTRTMYTTIAELLEKGMTVDLTTLYAEGLSATLVASFEDVPAGNGKYYADALKEHTKKRQLATLIKLITDSLKEKREAVEIISEIETELYRIQDRQGNEVGHIKTYLSGAIEEIEAAYKAGDRLLGVCSGFTDLDNALSGFQGGDLIVIAARTSIGKTAFALNIAENIAVGGTKCLFFSCEMSPNQICKRLLSSLGKIPHKALITGNLESENAFSQMTDAAEKIYTSQLYVDFTPNIAFQELKAKIRIAVRNGCKIVFVDYLTLVKYGDAKMPRRERVGELVKELKAIAIQLQVPVVVLSQLNRQAEGQKPTLAELSESGEIEQHSDVIVFLHRDRGSSDTEMIIAKQRNGQTGEWPLYFDEKQVRFQTGVKTYG